MSIEVPEYGTPEVSETVSGMAGEAVRQFYSFKNLQENATEMGEQELADMLGRAAVANRDSANTLLGILNPEDTQGPQ
ncbi:MAG: hypothetical protein ACREBW_04255 [Candidatus Micrarchaeaceae archaeon]